MNDGACGCGDLRYRLTAAPIVVNCRDRQTITGSAFAPNAMIETGAIEATQGQPVVHSLERGFRGGRGMARLRATFA